MVTEIDERRGLVKTQWATVRKRVAAVQPVFAKLVDELSPDKTFPLYLAYLPYGSYKGDTKSSFIPRVDGTYYRLSDADAPSDIIKHLGYGKHSSPMGMILEKEFEYFVDLKDEGITIPNAVCRPGAVFPITRILSQQNRRIYAPNGVLTMTAGVRSTFMLPNIGCLTNHTNLQRDFNVKGSPPKSLYEHWNVFKQIANSEVINNDWRACLMYFSEKWVARMHADKAWNKLKSYIMKLGWEQSEFQRNYFYFDIIFSIIQKKRNLKPNPYLVDTARHLFTTAFGEAPGYVPACNNDSMPIDVLQHAFVESYGLKKYIPTIMHAAHYNFENDELPIYYSLQNPSTHAFSPKSREVSSTLFEMRELEHIVKLFVEELASEQGICSDTSIYKIAKNIKFNYFHNKPDRHKVVRLSSEIARLDTRFDYVSESSGATKAIFSSDAPFVRGCISISKK